MLRNRQHQYCPEPIKRLYRKINPLWPQGQDCILSWQLLHSRKDVTKRRGEQNCHSCRNVLLVPQIQAGPLLPDRREVDGQTCETHNGRWYCLDSKNRVLAWRNILKVWKFLNC